VEDRVDPKGLLSAGGSVAATAWDFARLLGTGAVWIAGLDLAFPGLRTHCAGAVFENRSHAESSRFVPAATWSERALRDGGLFRAAAASGGEVLTDRRLSLYAAWFENRFREYPGIRNFRLFPEGLAIGGLENARPEDLLALPPRRGEIEKRLERTFARMARTFGDDAGERARRYDEARAALLRGLSRAAQAAEKGAAIAENALRRTGGREQAEILAALDEVNRTIAHSEVKAVAGFLFPPAGELEAGLAADSPFRRHLEFSARFYRALKEAAAYNLAELRRPR
jgi:hypothetical protein